MNSYRGIILTNHLLSQRPCVYSLHALLLAVVCAVQRGHGVVVRRLCLGCGA